MTGYLLLMILLASLAGYMINRQAARAQIRAGARFHSLASFHGAYAVALSGLPALILVLLWLLLQERVLELITMAAIAPEHLAGLAPGELSLVKAEIRAIADGRIFGDPEPWKREAAAYFLALREIAATALWAVTAAVLAIGLMIARRRVAAAFRARDRVERVVTILMLASAAAAILVTAGILAALLFESIRFFQRVPVADFLFGLNWEPQIPLRADQIAAEGAFGWVPVFVGTLLITAIAITVAIPIGILSAIYLFEFAAPRTRAIAKPLLEILAGIPTVVYGFFAVLVVAPALRAAGAALGIDIAPNTALAAGGAMGIMLIPFISSFTDDALQAVPRALRDGSLALGATRGETILKVLFPAALPGIVGGILLAVSRAIGETMIVVMAAGLIATLTLNPLDSVTTVTVQIVTLLIGDTEFDNPKTLAAFALGLVLFLVTLALNVVALGVVRRYRELYD
ncbi:MAG: phosphate ABC transporter permease subunit PstC [Alphaproteobacteria bacterium]|nr:MAG: phosphate ABC transporter permease subunit PstC [Alphaproteobacteria bacterium]